MIESADKTEDVPFVISYDYDDAPMTPDVIAATQGLACEVLCFAGASKTKIEAVNADIDRVGGWDVLLVISDDMFCRRKGWDSLIIQNMNTHFPDTDGSLWFYDGSQRKINTIPCLGRKYFYRFCTDNKNETNT